jgi:hypothetical protein
MSDKRSHSMTLKLFSIPKTRTYAAISGRQRIRLGQKYPKDCFVVACQPKGKIDIKAQLLNSTAIFVNRHRPPLTARAQISMRTRTVRIIAQSKQRRIAAIGGARMHAAKNTEILVCRTLIPRRTLIRGAGRSASQPVRQRRPELVGRIFAAGFPMIRLDKCSLAPRRTR